MRLVNIDKWLYDNGFQPVKFCSDWVEYVKTSDSIEMHVVNSLRFEDTHAFLVDPKDGTITFDRFIVPDIPLDIPSVSSCAWTWIPREERREYANS